MTQAERLAELKRIAWDIRDLDLFDFYNGVERDLERLRAVGLLVASIYQKGGYSDEQWSALFEALSDAGLLDDL